VKVGLTYCHPIGQATSAIDYVLYQEKHETEVLKIQKLDVVANVSDHQPIQLQYKFDHNIRKKQKELCNHSSKVNWNFHSAQLMVRYKIIDIFFSLRLDSF
jgi:hypothetical protein